MEGSSLEEELHELLESGLVDHWAGRPEWICKTLQITEAHQPELYQFLNTEHGVLAGLTGLEVLTGSFLREREGPPAQVKHLLVSLGRYDRFSRLMLAANIQVLTRFLGSPRDSTTMAYYHEWLKGVPKAQAPWQPDEHPDQFI